MIACSESFFVIALDTRRLLRTPEVCKDLQSTDQMVLEVQRVQHKPEMENIRLHSTSCICEMCWSQTSGAICTLKTRFHGFWFGSHFFKFPYGSVSSWQQFGDKVVSSFKLRGHRDSRMHCMYQFMYYILYKPLIRVFDHI